MIIKSLFKYIALIIFFFGLYIQIQGENGVGGGFQSGIIFASGIIFYSLIYDKKPSINLLKKISAFGFLIYFMVGIFSVFLGKSFLDYNHSFGQRYSIFFVEIAVSITVLSSVLLIYFEIDKND